MSGDLLKRLEAVAARLEAYASGLKPRGGGDSKGDSAAVSAYDGYYAASVQPFIDTCRKVKETVTLGDWTEQAFKHLRVVLQAASACKKPSPDALMKFVGPIAEVISTSDAKVDNRSAFHSQQKAFAEGIQGLQWIVAQGASKPICQGAVEAADFYLIKILKAAKDKTGDDAANLKNFATGFKDMLLKLGEFAHEFYKLGLDWNPKGGDLSSFSAGDSGSSSGGGGDAGAGDDSGAPPPPAGPPPSFEELGGSSEAPKPAGAPGMGAVFAEISKGEGVTSGLKKVTADMKAKNMKDKPVLVPKEKAKADGPKKFKVEEKKKEPKLELQKGTWFCEFYEDQEITIPDIEVKQAVYLSKCRGAVINIPNKCKSIAVDSCFKTQVNFKAVVSTFEVVNCQRVICAVGESCPSVAIDKSQGCQVHLSREALKNPPQIVTSNISETNIQVPGAKDEDDPIEIPVPEQFCTKIGAGNKLSTAPVTQWPSTLR